jgi:hypothetical protein
MIQSRRRLIAIALAATTLALAGCGGSSPRPTASAGAPKAGRSAPGSRARAGARRRHSGARSPRAHVARSRRRRVARRSPRARPRTPGFVAAGSPSALRRLASILPSSSSCSTSGGSNSGSRFLASADGICSGYRATVRGIGTGATTLALQEAELHNLVLATAAALRRLRALSPPRAGAGLAGRFVNLTATSVADFVYAQSRSGSTSEAVGVRSETQDLALARRSASAAVAAAAAARRLGLHVCGSPGAEWL